MALLKNVTLFLNILQLCMFKLRNLSVCVRNSCIKGLTESCSKVTNSLQIEKRMFPSVHTKPCAKEQSKSFRIVNNT
jgi:hypothetical protein